MNNYVYIISSLPAISLDWKFSDGTSFKTYTDWIKTQLDDADKKTLDILLKGFEGDNLNDAFYTEALSSSNNFIKDYFSFDLNVRNRKAMFLNKAFSRPIKDDTIELETAGYDDGNSVDSIFLDPDLLSREHKLDALMWNKIASMTSLDAFSFEAVLAFVAKLRIIARWSELDEAKGRERFKTLVSDIRGTFSGVNYSAPTE